MGTMFVLAFVDTSGAEPRIVKFGPTSERPDLLQSFDMPWASGADRRIVVPVMSGGLLRVSARALADALAGGQ